MPVACRMAASSGLLEVRKALLPASNPKLPYNSVKDFAPITQMVRIPNVLVMNAETAKRLNITNLKEFIAYAKANPAKLSYASGGNGSGGHLAGEMFKTRAGIYAVHIPYNGGGPSQLAMLSGTVDFTLDNLATSGVNIRAGKVIPLAVTTLKRSPLLPDVPTFRELGYPSVVGETWYAVFAPAGTPPEAIARLNAGLRDVLAMPDVKQKLLDLGFMPIGGTPAEYQTFLDAEVVRWRKVIKDGNIPSPA